LELQADVRLDHAERVADQPDVERRQRARPAQRVAVVGVGRGLVEQEVAVPQEAEEPAVDVEDGQVAARGVDRRFVLGLSDELEELGQALDRHPLLLPEGPVVGVAHEEHLLRRDDAAVRAEDDPGERRAGAFRAENEDEASLIGFVGGRRHPPFL
jgi:hypothetical protein